jgi:hypothetical protein
VAIVAALLTGAPAVVRADETAEREAQARFEEGLARVKAGDFEAARISFTQAYAVLKRPRILLNLALTEEKTEHLAEALAHFKQISRESSTSEADRADAQAHVAALMPRTAHIEVHAPIGAPLMLDGGPLAFVSPLPEALDVTPGHHVVEARLTQGERAIVVDAIAGQVAQADFAGGEAIRPLPPAMPAPGTNVAAANPPSALPPAPEPKKQSNARAITVASIGGAGLVSLAVGFGFAVAANNLSDDMHVLQAMNPSCPPQPTAGPCLDLANDASTRSDDINAARIFIVAGGVLVVGAVATWLFWPRHSPQAVAVVPAVSEHQAGATLIGRF